MVMIGLIGVALTLAIRTDRRAARRVRVLVDGRDSGVVAVVAERWANCRVGLLNHLGLPPGAGLLLEGSKSVHSEGMLFDFDVCFLDRDLRVTGVVAGIRPSANAVRGPAGSVKALELAAGGAAAAGIAVGRQLELKE
jgi:uncharacterized membrane protein (UPF0127 family)